MNTETRAQLALLKCELEAGHISKKDYLEFALKLGISIQTAYAVLDESVGVSPSAPGDDVTAKKAEELRRALGRDGQGRIVDMTDKAPRPDQENGVKERIARLREQVQRIVLKPDSSRENDPHAWVDWDNDYTKWGDFDNWGNWDNTFGNWHNWSNTWDNK